MSNLTQTASRKKKLLVSNTGEGRGGGGELLLRIIGGGVPPGSPNPDPISHQNMAFSTPVFRPDL